MRKEGDSNPRYAFYVNTLSRRKRKKTINEQIIRHLRKVLKHTFCMQIVDLFSASSHCTCKQIV